jgi:hypothetical protein
VSGADLIVDERAGGGDIGGDELAVLQEFTNMALECGAEGRQLGKTDSAQAALDPVVGEALHAEEACRLVLGQPEAPPPAAQCRTYARLGLEPALHHRFACRHPEEPRRQRLAGAHGLRSIACPARCSDLSHGKSDMLKSQYCQ